MKVETIINTKKKILSLYEVANNTGDYISLIQTAFVYNTSKPLQGCKEQAENSRKQADQISTIITAYAIDDPYLKPYIPVPAHIINIWESLDKLTELTATKIEGNILFSDEARDETIYLLQRLIEILRPTVDMILARNTFLSIRS
jgi:hypothetical protein